MKILGRYIVFSILSVGLAVTLFASVMMMGVDLFRNLDTYVTYNVSSHDVVRLTLLYFPESVLFTIGPSFLFSVTYFLSMLHANNEIIAVLNSTINYRKVLIPIIACGLAVSLFWFVFNEKAGLPCTSQKEKLKEAVTTGESGPEDNYRIALSDMTRNYMVYASRYVNSTQTLYNITFIQSFSDNVIERIDARRAVWDNERQMWQFFDAMVYESSADGSILNTRSEESYYEQNLGLEPEMFRNLSNDISKMPLGIARKYVSRMRYLNPEQYAEMASSYYERVFGGLTVLVLVIIACAMNYRFKKNILFFSLVFSVVVAVVYYVVRMMTMMMSRQGIIAPYLGTLTPFIVILILSGLAAYLTRN